MSCRSPLTAVEFGMMAYTLIVFIFSALQAASKGHGAQGTINALM